MINSKYATYLEQPPVIKPLWKAALYIRLSKEDGDKGESNSVTSQREILKEYLNNGYHELNKENNNYLFLKLI